MQLGKEMKSKLIIGSHIGLSSPNYLLDVIKETIDNGANTFMIYTGAPQNTIRKDVSLFRIEEAHKLLNKFNILPDNVIIHAPYIINLCSSKKETRELAIEFLTKELIRVKQMGFNKLVLHPGSRLDQPLEIGISQIVYGIKIALEKANNDVFILLETMAGKGSEIGSNMNEISAIIKGVNSDRIGVCLDTCHLHDSGVDLSKFDDYLIQFNELIGINKIKCIHINDSKNTMGAKKDRHENLGYGQIGFDNLINIIYHEKLMNIPKILETPWPKINGKEIYPYKKEIEIIKNHKFYKWF